MAGGAAQSITIADLSNVIHFVIDAASKASAESQMKKMRQEASKNNQVPIKPQVDSDAAGKALETLQSLKSKATALLGFIGISVGFAQFRELTEEFNGINDSINYATQGLDNQKEIQQEILQAANDCKATYGDLAAYTVKLKQQNEDLFPIDQAAQFAKLVNQVEQNAGNGDAVGTVQMLLSTVFATGEMSETTLNRLTKKFPEVVNVISDGMGVTREEFTKLASAGKVTAEDVKNAYFAAADNIQKTYDGLDYSISDGLTNIRNRLGYKLDELNVKFGITQTIAQTMVKVFGVIEKGITVVENVGEKLADAVGGTENLFRLVALAVAAIFTAWQGDKIIKGIQTISALLTPARLKMMGIAAAILAVFLLVEDFVAFLQCKDSVIGELLKGAGVDVDEAREKIIGFFNGAKEVAGRVLTAIGDFWAKHKDKIFAVLQGAWSLVQVVFNLIYTFIRGVIDKIGAFWDEHGDDVMSILSAIGSFVQTVFGGIQQIISAVVANISQWWNTYGDDVLSMLASLEQAFSDIGNFIMDVFGGAIAYVADLVNGDFSAAFDDLKQLASDVLNDVNQFFKDAFGIDILGAIADFVDGAEKLLDKFFGWVSQNFPNLSGLISGAVQGVQNFLGGGDSNTNGAVSAATVGNAVSGGQTNNTNTVTQTFNQNFNVTERNTASTASDAVKNSSKQGSEAISSKMKYMGR